MPTPARTDPLVIRHFEFLGGMAAAGGWRPASGLPEIALAGRSNVGKSSLLNVLVQRRSAARVSRHPGKTREINFFLINNAFVLADLPGYGFARVSHTVRAAWRPLVEGYLRDSEALRGIVQLVDARHDPSRDDLQMIDFLAELGVPTVIALTKVDKLRPREVPARFEAVREALGADDSQLIPFSAVTGQGREELGGAIASLLEAPPWR